jgi:DNA-binding MarR family transcriptional regulator
MTKHLLDEIQQKKPFGSLEQEAFLNVVRTAAELTDSFERVLAPAGITSSQYNVLRILRGAGNAGLCRNEVRDRMLTRMPDMTRLLDRMEKSGLVARARGLADRRVVTTEITDKGIRLLDELESAVAQEHARRLGHMSSDQLSLLIDLLSEVREGS